MTSWNENKPNADHTRELIDSFKEGLQLLKQPQIFFLGLVDSIYNCAIQIIVFIWTPVLQDTAMTKNINPAMIYMIMILTILVHNKTLELLNRSLHINFFILAATYLLFFLFNWVLIYYSDSFETRLLCLALINVKYFLRLGIWRTL
jgi:hypothetical protein